MWNRNALYDLITRAASRHNNCSGSARWLAGYAVVVYGAAAGISISISKLCALRYFRWIRKRADKRNAAPAEWAAEGLYGFSSGRRHDVACIWICSTIVIGWFTIKWLIIQWAALLPTIIIYPCCGRPVWLSCDGSHLIETGARDGIERERKSD